MTVCTTFLSLTVATAFGDPMTDVPPDLRGGQVGPIHLAAFDPAPATYGSDDFHHYAWILDEEQRAQYSDGDAAARREVVRVAFAAIDPTPATPENERRDEHFRRVACARTMFPRPSPPWWDDRGELIIRYGAPSYRGSSIGGQKEPNREVWIYSGLQLAFELEDELLNDRFRLVASRSRKLARADEFLEAPIDFGVPIRAWGRNDHFPTAFRVPDFEARRVAADYSRLVERGTQVLRAYPEIHVHDYGGEWLPVAFDAVSFSSPDSGLTRLEVHTGIRARDLIYERSGGQWHATLALDAVVKTSDYRDVVRTRKTSRDYRLTLDDLEDRLVLDGVDLLLEPGTYRLAISVRDTTSKRMGTFQRDVEVVEFPSGELAVSGIQTAFGIGAAEAGAPFRKGDLQVTPWPLARFPRKREVNLYFEIYGLTESPTGDTFFLVEVLLRPREPEKTGWFGIGGGGSTPGVSTSWGGRAQGPIVREHFALDTEAIGPGTFDVKITVTDKLGESTAERWTAVTVAE
ncbi:MAG TPA: GWxTD domain-containing protein [bacterium]|nr:GWxTD domain-containing protein [bacterium]